MKVLIIEDEKFAADKLEKMLLDINPSIEILAKIGSIKESVKWLLQNTADLIFLDIQLSDGISFTIFEQVPVTTPIIFTTAYDQYAIKAFQLNSIAYLLKPVRNRDLEETLKKYETLKSSFAIDFELLLKQMQGNQPDYKKRFLIQIGEKIRKIEVSEIAMFFVQDKTTFLKTFPGKNYPVEKLGRTFDNSGNKNLEICFETDDFQLVVQNLKKYQLKYLHKETEELWGQQTIRFFDPENNLVEIGETLPCFVKRFHNQGMTIEEVSKRTSVPTELVSKICQTDKN